MSITVILNLYNRPENLAEQMEAVLTQTLKPDKVIIWDNSNTGRCLYPDFGNIVHIRSSHNFKYHGRFAAALLSETDYVAILDDDTIPGDEWLENCLYWHLKTQGLIVGIGVIYNDRNDYFNQKRAGWGNAVRKPCAVITEVDLGGHAWFFPYSYLHYFWSERLASLDSGEDHHFSYVLQRNGIKTYVPPQIYDHNSASLRGEELGNFKAASATDNNLNLRMGVIKEYLKRGWKTINNI